jgi:hypothetical protein
MSHSCRMASIPPFSAFLLTFPRDFDGSVPPHFYGELVKTDLGCQVLHEKGHFSDFAQLIRLHGHESEDPDMIIKLKSVLWAVVSFQNDFPVYVSLMTPRVTSALQKVASTSWKKKRLLQTSLTS